MTIFKYIYKSLFSNKDKRNNVINRNILGVGIARGLNILISFLIVPVTIHYIDPTNYGIWLTLSSIIAWVSIFDIGISNGLRNRLGEALALNDMILACKLVSTTYVYIGLIFIPLMLILLVLNLFVNWCDILNITYNNGNLNVIVSIIIVYFCLRFILSTVNTLCLAEQRVAESSFRVLAEQLISFLVTLVLVHTTTGSLLHLTVATCVAPLLLLILFNLFLFRGRYKPIKPTLKNVDFTLGKQILSLGFKFFIIQIAGIVLFQTANLIIIRYIGAEEVASYNIANKYFSILTMGMSIFTAPLWSAVTHAQANGDYIWIKKNVSKYLKIAVFFLILGVIMLSISNFSYKIWVGTDIKIPFVLSFWLFIFNLISVFGGVFCGALNGLSILKKQFTCSVISPFIFIILCYLFIIHFHWGVVSIVVAMIIANFNGYIFAPWDYYKFVKKHIK